MAPEAQAVSTRATFILMLVFMSLGTLAMFDPFHWKQKREEAKEKDHHLLWLKDAKLSSLSITSSEGTFDLGCDAATGCPLDSQGNWHVQRPVVDVADESAVGALLNSLKNTQVVESIDLDDPGKFGEYGLDAPELQITFHLAGDSSAHFLKVGKATAIGPNLYAFSSERQKVIYIIPAVFTNVAKGGAFHWRNKRLFPDLGVNDLSSIAWNNFEFQKEKNDWLFKKPIAVKANSVVIGGLSTTLTYLNAKSVVAENQTSPEALQLLKGKPVLQFQLEGAKQKKYSLELFRQAKTDSSDYVARVSGKPGLYMVDAAEISRFQKDIFEYREHKLLTEADRSLIDRVEFQFPRDKRKLALIREAGVWKLAPGEEAKEAFSSDRINAFLDSLAQADVESFVKKGKEKLADLALTISFGKEQRLYHFTIDGKQNALVEGEIPAEQRRFGLDILRHLPVRYADLLAATNKKVITSEPNGKHPDPSAP